MLGYYGSTIGPKDPEVLKLAEASAKKTPIVCRPADLLKPEWEALRSQALALEGCNGSDEDVLTYAMFPNVAPKFFASRAQGPKSPLTPKAAEKKDGPAAKPGEDGSKSITSPVNYLVTVGGQSHKVRVEPA